MSLATALTQFALARVLTWGQVERLLQLAEVDVEAAIRDVEFDAWWNGHILATRQRMATLNMLDKLLDPRRAA